MKNLHVTFLTSLFIISCSQSFAQQTIVSEDWQTSAGTQNLFHKSFTKTDASHNVYVTGATLNGDGNYDLIISKYNSSGVHQWTNQIDGAGHGDDVATGIYIDGSSNVHITGTVYTGTTDSNDVVTIKYNSSGTQQWQKIYAGSAHRNDYGTAITGDASGNIYITGLKTTSSNKTDFITVKYNSSGTQKWASSYDGSAHLYDGGAKISYSATSAGVAVAGGCQTNATNVEYRTLNYNATTGAQTATSGSGGSSSGIDEINDLVIDASGNVYVTGGIVNTGTGYDIYTIKLNSSLATQWTATYNATDSLDDKGKSVIVDASGNVYITGYSSGATTNKNAVTIKYNSSGAQQWVSTFNNNAENGDDEGADIERRSNGEIIISGYSFNGANKDYNTIKYNSSGVQQWIKSFNGSSNGDDRALDLALDADQNIIVCGQSWVDTAFEYVTVKYSEYSIDYDAVLDSLDRPIYADQQIIIRFDTSILNKSELNKKGKVYGGIYEFVDSFLVDSIVQKLDMPSFENAKCLKIYPSFNEYDTVTYSRSGRKNYLPPVWSSLLVTFSFSKGATVIDVCDELNDRDSATTLFPLIKWVNPNWAFILHGTVPNDQYYEDDQLSLSPNASFPQYEDAHIDAEGAWANNAKGSTQINVGVFDSGIRWSHDDFSTDESNDWEPSKIEGGNDYTQTSPQPIDQNAGNDVYGHGTQCAGIIGALRNNNSIGIAGIAGGDWDDDVNSGANLYAMKCFDDNGMSYFNWIGAGLLEGATTTADGLPLDIFSCSWSITPNIAMDNPLYINEVKEKYRIAFNNEVMIVNSRGNSGSSGNDGQAYPANFFSGYQIGDDWLLSIGASGEDGESAEPGNCDPYYSIHGPQLDVIAPGCTSLVYTTSAAGDDVYSTFSGTSASAPHVAGVAALVIDYHSTAVLAPEDVEHILEYSANDQNTAGYDELTGYGLLQAGQAIVLVLEPEYRIVHYEAEVQTTQTDDPPAEDQQAANTPLILTEDYVPENGDATVPAGNWLVDVWKVTTTVDHNLPGSATIYSNTNEPGYWIRNSGSNLWGAPNGNDEILPETTIGFIGTPDETSATVFGYYYGIRFTFLEDPYYIPRHAKYSNTEPEYLAYSLLIHDEEFNFTEDMVQSENSFVVFPNPAQTNLFIKYNLEESSSVQFEIMSIDDKNYKTLTVNNADPGYHQMQFDIAALSSGVYFVKVTTDSEIQVLKFIKQ